VPQRPSRPAIGAIAFAGSAAATAVRAVPFLMTPQHPMGAAPVAIGTIPKTKALSMPARLSADRQLHHPRGSRTIVIDTPHTYFITCSADGRAIRSASASAATVLPGRVVNRLARRPRGRLDPAPGNDRAPALSAAQNAGVPAIRLVARDM